MSGTKSFTYDNILIEFNTEALVHICATLAEISDLSFCGNCEKLDCIVSIKTRSPYPFQNLPFSHIFLFEI